jgi:hypothetical protein
MINSKSHLTIGKEYKVIDVVNTFLDDLDEQTLIIENDNGETHWYNDIRFIPKSDYRTQLINEIIK